MTTLAENIKKIREEKGITLEKVADHMGKPVQLIKMLEDGDINYLSTIQIMQLAEVLKTRPSVLMGREEE